MIQDHTQITSLHKTAKTMSSDISQLRVPELRKLAKERGINVGRMKKQELLSVLQQSQSAPVRSLPLESLPIRMLKDLAVLFDVETKGKKKSQLLSAIAEAEGTRKSLQRVRESMWELQHLNKDLFDRIKYVLSSLPDMRPFSVDMVTKIDWNPWEELVSEYKTFSDLSGRFGSAESRLLVLVDSDSSSLSEAPDPSIYSMNPFDNPARYLGAVKTQFTNLKREDLMQLYYKYPMLMWIYLADYPDQLGPIFPFTAQILYLVDLMPRNSPFFILNALEKAKLWPRIALQLDPPAYDYGTLMPLLKLLVYREIVYLPSETIDPLHTKLLAAVGRTGPSIRPLKLVKRLIKKTLNSGRYEAYVIRLYELLLDDEGIQRDQPIYITLAEMLAGDGIPTHLQAHRKLIGTGKIRYFVNNTDSEFNWKAGWDLDTALYFLNKVSGTPRLRMDLFSLMRLMVGSIVPDKESRAFAVRAIAIDPFLLADVIREIADIVPPNHINYAVIHAVTLELLEAKPSAKAFHSLADAYIELYPGIEELVYEKKRYRSRVPYGGRIGNPKTFLKILSVPNALQLSPEWPIRALVNVSPGEIMQLTALPVFDYPDVRGYIRKHSPAKVSFEMCVRYKVAVESIAIDAPEQLYEHLKWFSDHYNEMYELHIWALLTKPHLYFAGDPEFRLNPLLEKLIAVSGAQTALSIYVRMGNILGIRVALREGADIAALDPLEVVGTPQEALAYLQMEQAY